ncbi:carbohydrate sulfotransferase 11-like [Amphiura filiformis]|uniref:carbohydrate sulfotransferase 11-like n=1 Tax=Amphiura filiformis TaxID=82378 RepID=UPI003B215467
MRMATSSQRTGLLVFLLVVIFMAGVGVYIMPYSDTAVVVETQYSKTPKLKPPVTSSNKVKTSINDETNEHDEEQNFMDAQERRQENRRAILSEGCRKFYNGPPRDVIANGIDKNTLIVDDEHKLLYCFVPKIACTNWKQVFLVLGRIYKSTNDVSQYLANRSMRKLKTFRNLQKDERTRILNTYTKFIFVRHPFSRLLSAFKNKLSPDSSFERAQYWRNTIGTQIMYKNRRLNPLNRTSLLDLKHYDLRFEEFVRHVGNPSHPLPQNKHWKEISERCYPCDINYDVIGKFETLNEDARYILKLAKVHDVEFPKPDASSPTNSSNLTTLEAYYEQVPKQDMQNLIRRYRLDFELFGYSPHTQDSDPFYRNTTTDTENMSWTDDISLYP